MKKMMSLLLAAAFTGVVSGATNPEKAGICFRFDDNQPPERWQKMAEIFEKHGYRFSMAINSEKAAADPAYAKLLSDMAARGYEVMDHTPEHTIIKLTLPRAEVANALAKEDYVDYVHDRTVFFKFRFDRSDPGNREMVLSFDGNRILNGKESGLKQDDISRYLVFPDGSIYMIAPNKDEFKLLSKHCEDNVNLPKQENVKTILASRNAFQIDDRALEQIARRTQELHKKMNLPAPKTFITPGGWGLFPAAEQIQRVYGRQFQYSAGDAYYPEWGNCFSGNQLDRYRMSPYWNSLETNDVSREKKLFADLLATNHVIPVISHMWLHGVNNNFEELLRRNDEFLAWVKAKKIPVKNYAEWAEILYNPSKDRSWNLFPQFDCDLNEDGIPDGFSLDKNSSVKDGVLTGKGGLFYIRSLAGFTQGRNVIRVEGKAVSGKAKLILVFHFCRANSTASSKDVGVSFEFPSDREFAAVEKSIEVPTWAAGAHVTDVMDGEGSVKNISFVPKNE